ncbi:MAG TPA: T9SS type A sorting domain-containing protein, partial [Flavobacterium sp.]|nr:T9SS type A sorting domain-containing protein [Flavobacterium sp.]
VKSGYEEENLKQIDTYQDADVELYPNPSSGFVTLHIPKHLVNSAVTIFNALGQKLTETQVKESTVLLNLADLPSGHYFIVIQNTDNIIKKGFNPELKYLL